MQLSLSETLRDDELEADLNLTCESDAGAVAGTAGAVTCDGGAVAGKAGAVTGDGGAVAATTGAVDTASLANTALNVSARLAELRSLPPGWLDGEGAPLPESGVTWFDSVWGNHWPKDAPLPHIYPSIDGGIHLEWFSPKSSVTAEVDLTKRSAAVHMHWSIPVDGSQGAANCAELMLDLEREFSWKALAALVRSYGS